MLGVTGLISNVEGGLASVARVGGVVHRVRGVDHGHDSYTDTVPDDIVHHSTQKSQECHHVPQLEPPSS